MTLSMETPDALLGRLKRRAVSELAARGEIDTAAARLYLGSDV